MFGILGKPGELSGFEAKAFVQTNSAEASVHTVHGK